MATRRDYLQRMTTGWQATVAIFYHKQWRLCGYVSIRSRNKREHYLRSSVRDSFPVFRKVLPSSVFARRVHRI